MLLAGNNCITDDEARTQMAIWSILAAPLIMGNDLRTVTPSQRDILLNPEVIAVDQGALMCVRVCVCVCVCLEV
jgi:alpha-galactosidase